MIARALGMAGLLLAAASCGGYPASPDEDVLTGTWVGSVPRPPFFVDDMRLELVQNGRALSGQGARGRPCPNDGTCYADVTVAGTIVGTKVTLLFGPPFSDGFAGTRRPDGDLVGTLTAYSDKPQLTLRRIRE